MFDPRGVCGERTMWLVIGLVLDNHHRGAGHYPSTAAGGTGGVTEGKMPSDNTATKDYLMGSADAVLTCPTCHHLMVDGPLVLQHLLVVGTLTVADLPVRFVHLSHTLPAADGGTEAALECGTCNHRRGQAPWNPPAGTTVARVGRLAAYAEAHAAAKRFRAWLTDWS